MVIKYIFTEDGDEEIYQIKYINRGNYDICTIRQKFSNTYTISNVTIDGADNLNYKLESNELEINFYLKRNKYAILTYKLFHEFVPSKFYRSVNFTIRKGRKYIIRARQPLELVGSEYGRLKEGKQKNGALYYYFDDDINYDFDDTVYISAHEIKFESFLTLKFDWILWRTLYYVKAPNMHEFGNNEILSDEVISNLKRDEFTVERDKKYITIRSNKKKSKFAFVFYKKFRNNLDNEWIMDGADLVNTCTTKTKNKVEEILSNLNSNEKNYVILGRWVYHNIKYDIYAGEGWTVDQILDYQTGVSIHKTQLFNAFLNCINIDSIYVTGFVQTSNDVYISWKSLHAWTLAKIDGRWLTLDATWNIFNGKLPLGFVFRYYEDDNRGIDARWHLFSDILSNKSKNSMLLDSYPEVDLMIQATSFNSREIEDDDEGDFEVKFDDYTLFYIIISCGAVLIIGIIISIVIICLTKKKKKEKDSDLNISLSIND